VRSLHRFPYHAYEFAIEDRKVRLISQLYGEGFQGFSGVVPSPVEAPSYEALKAAPEGVEQRGDQERGGHDC
jgi:hypothetical protein